MKNKNFQYSVQKIVEWMLIEFTAILSECEKQVTFSGNPKGASRDFPCLGSNKERIANVLLIFRKNGHLWRVAVSSGQNTGKKEAAFSARKASGAMRSTPSTP